MQQFKTLLIKDYWTYKHTILLPAYICLGWLALMIILSGIILFIYRDEIDMAKVMIGQGVVTYVDNDGNEVAETLDLKGEMSEEIDEGYWILGVTIAGFPLAMIFFAYIGLTGKLLNDDYKKKCALFHTTLPVSLIKRLGAKLTLLFSSTLGMAIALSLINFILILILVIISPGRIFFFEVFSTTFVSIMHTIFAWSITFALLFSFNWSNNAIFKENAFMKAIMILIGIIGIAYAVGAIVGKVGAVNYALVSIINFILPNNYGGINFNGNIILASLAGIFSLNTLYKLLVASMFYALGWWIVSKREV